MSMKYAMIAEVLLRFTDDLGRTATTRTSWGALFALRRAGTAGGAQNEKGPPCMRMGLFPNSNSVSEFGC